MGFKIMCYLCYQIMYHLKSNCNISSLYHKDHNVILYHKDHNVILFVSQRPQCHIILCYLVFFCTILLNWIPLHGPSLESLPSGNSESLGLIGAVVGPAGPGLSESDPESSPVRESGSLAAAPGPGPGQGPGPALPEVAQRQGPGQ